MHSAGPRASPIDSPRVRVTHVPRDPDLYSIRYRFTFFIDSQFFSSVSGFFVSFVCSFFGARLAANLSGNFLFFLFFTATYCWPRWTVQRLVFRFYIDRSFLMVEKLKCLSIEPLATFLYGKCDSALSKVLNTVTVIR